MPVEDNSYLLILVLLLGAVAFALPSLYEGFGLPALEAMACGTPVIATAVGGVPEIVTSRDGGIVVNQRSAHALARAVRELFARQTRPGWLSWGDGVPNARASTRNAKDERRQRRSA